MKILTIEDSEFERKLIVNILHKSGYDDVIEAADGEEGLRKYNDEKPDLILLDLRMPGMSGMEVLQKINPTTAKVKVIVIIVSIVRKKETIQEAMSLGAKDYIVKPIEEKKLMAAIQKVIEENGV